RSGGRPGRAGVGVPAGPAGGGTPCDDAAVVLAGAAALVPVHLGRRGSLEPGDAGRGQGLLPLAPAGRQAPPDDSRAGGAGGSAVRVVVRVVDGGDLRDGLPEFLRLTPGRRDRADREPVPVGQGRAGARAPQPAGPVPEAAVRPVPAAGPAEDPEADPGGG